MPKINLTDHELQALKEQYNFADAHARYSIADYQGEVVSNFEEVWESAQNNKQHETESEFLSTFFRSQGIYDQPDLKKCFINYSSSVSISLAAQYCRLKKKKVLLHEPTFDNLPDLFEDHSVSIHAISEIEIAKFINGEYYLPRGIGALFLVLPNNPTGFALLNNESNFRKCITKASDNGLILIIDLCFSPFLNLSLIHI